mgnify:CR=1 FL=1
MKAAIVLDQLVDGFILLCSTIATHTEQIRSCCHMIIVQWLHLHTRKLWWQKHKLANDSTNLTALCQKAFSPGSMSRIDTGNYPWYIWVNNSFTEFWIYQGPTPEYVEELGFGRFYLNTSGTCSGCVFLETEWVPDFYIVIIPNTFRIFPSKYPEKVLD